MMNCDGIKTQETLAFGAVALGSGGLGGESES